MAAEGQTNIINLVRCAWAGSQRYGALVWSGDIASSFEVLSLQVRAGLNMAIAGIPWWTTDIGGFHGGNPDDPGFRECIIRWFQYGVFCPVFRLHGDRVPSSPGIGTSGGGICSSGAANEVWSYGDEAYEIMVSYMNLRERLRPYITMLMEKAHEKGTPPMRPLLYDFPQDPQAWDVDDQYMFGPDLLVAPILQEGMRSRTVYLPSGTSWTDPYTGETVEGGVSLTVEAPLERIPLFLRDGAKLPIV
jgi:alpha-D-xyloside xylohydrolase